MAQEPIFKFQPTITPFQSKNHKQAQEHIEIKATQNIEDKELTFHPKIGKPPTNLAEPVSERLYAYKDTYMDSLTQRQMGEYNKGCATKAVIPKSNILVENRRRKNYESIFRCLDTDKDGLIDPNDINIRRLPAKIGEIYVPLIRNILMKKEKVTYKEFVRESNKLYDNLGHNEKAALNSPHTRQVKEVDPVLGYPMLNKHSLDLAAKTKRPPNQDWLTTIQNEKTGEDKKYAELKILKEKEELSKCTFKPTLNEQREPSSNLVKVYETFVNGI